MAAQLHIGAKSLRGSIEAYSKHFGLLEVRMSDKTSPNVATMKRWRKVVPREFEFVVVGGAALSRVKSSADLDKEFEEAVEAVNVLGARCFLLRTHPDVTPSNLWRDRLGKLLERFPSDATQVAWEASGLWEPDDIRAQAKQWGVVPVLDAARETLLSGPVAYIRLRALGETRSYGASAIERIADQIGPNRRDVYVVLESDGAMAEAKLLRKTLSRSKVKKTIGSARLVRPKAFRVRDDEQEE